MRDVIVVGIYLVFFAGNIAIIVKWQDRKTKSEESDGEAGGRRSVRASVDR